MTSLARNTKTSPSDNESCLYFSARSAHWLSSLLCILQWCSESSYFADKKISDSSLKCSLTCSISALIRFKQCSFDSPAIIAESSLLDN